MVPLDEINRTYEPSIRRCRRWCDVLFPLWATPTALADSEEMTYSWIEFDAIITVRQHRFCSPKISAFVMRKYVASVLQSFWQDSDDARGFHSGFESMLGLVHNFIRYLIFEQPLSRVPGAKLEIWITIRLASNFPRFGVARLGKTL